MASVDSMLALLDSLPLSGWGISDISVDTTPRYRNAISLLKAYNYPLDNYDPHDFNDFLLHDVKPALDNSVEVVSDFLDTNNIPFHVVTNQRKNPLLLTGEYSQKKAAVRAGLGWIGKNTLLITPNFGPRVRLATILTDWELPVSPSRMMPGCGYCSICVDCCPSMCLKNVNWEPGVSRENMIDIARCGETNDAIQHCICGVCLVACPVGQNNKIGTVIQR